MTKEPSLPARRRAIRKINYNERDADEDVVRRIQMMEKTRESIHAASIGKVKVHKTKHQDYLNDKTVGWNFIPSLPPTFRKHSRFSNILDLENANVDVKTDVLSQGNSILLKKDDHIYMVSEPPGEPYYIGRIVQFVSKPEFRQLIDEGRKYVSSFPAKYFQVKMNWYYRPRDVQEKSQNVSSRLVYASLHMDMCPIYSFRGKCTVVHRSTLDIPEDSRYDLLTKPNTFYFDQLFDRYTLQYYDIWSTRKQLLQLAPSSVYLSTVAKLYPFVFVEEQYPLKQVIEKYVLGAKLPKEQDWDLKCAECGSWCEKNICVKCDECHIPVHLYCLDPPLERRPVKGVIWVCSKCINNNDASSNDDYNAHSLESKLKKSIQHNDRSPKCSENLWFHYLGSKVVDHLQDILTPELMLPYPIKTLRTGSKYQWDGCENDSWRAKPYEDDLSSRGADKNMDILWKTDYSKISAKELDNYVRKCQERFPPELDILPQTCNFWDMILKILVSNDYNSELAMKVCAKSLSRETLREPSFSEKEIKKFEEGVAKHGSELHPVCKHVKTQPMAMIVRFYYHWKKTANGRQIWGNFEGRKKNKNKGLMGSKKKTEDVNKQSRVRKPSKIFRESEANNSKEWKHIDDSSFDSEKISTLKTFFKCMFCDVDYSPLWYRVTGGCDDDHIKTRMITGVNEKTSTSDKLPRQSRKVGDSDSGPSLEALCIRCARLWRRYAVRWDSPMDVVKRINGKYSSSVRTALDALLSDSNNTTVKISPNVLSDKCVEWELVQDSELIIKQRLQIIADSERLAKMKRNCLSVHAQLSKVVKRLVEIDTYAEEKMLKELKSFVDGYIHEAQRKEKKSKGRKGKAQIARIEEVAQLKASVPDTENRPPNSNNQSESINISESRIKGEPVTSSLVTQKQIPLAPIAPKNEIVIPCGENVLDVFIDDGRTKIGQIKVDAEFETLRLSEDLFLHIFKSDQVAGNSMAQSQSHSFDLVKDAGNTKALAVNGHLKSDSFLEFYQVTNGSNIPVIPDRSFAEIAEAYHNHNPLYYEWSQGKPPKLTYEQLQKTIKGISTLTHNNLGRRVKSPFQSASEVKQEEQVSMRDFCCVCHGKFKESLNEEIICGKCGLNVHYYCYGLDIPVHCKSRKDGLALKSLQWFCDVCSNDLNPITTLNYQCCLCNANEIDQEGAKKQLSRSIPDALKITSNGQWCHVSCSLFNENINYNCPGKLQCAGDISASLMQNRILACKICGMTGGGLVRCNECLLMSHVTCAQDTPGYLFRFQTYPSEKGLDEERIIRDGVDSFTIKPILICPGHKLSSRKYLPLDHEIKSGLTLLELYCNNYKCSPEYQKGTVKMATDNLRAVENSSGSQFSLQNSHSTPKGTRPVQDNNSGLLNKEKQCIRCRGEVSIFWFDNVCHSCYNSIPILAVDMPEYEKESDSECNMLDTKRNLILEEKYLKDISMEGVVSAITGPPKAKRPRAAGVPRGRKKTKSVKGSDLTPNNISVVVQNLSNRRPDNS
ncbi:LANO_0E03796g1_1 [Lachancea nothofagi CBS 11611]|uniref:LANO_0E03796g1_1 n=1 Tax=Lachancea nothofagi CBS 11611 TaxID=1266666 RepID=A0A1G4JRF6_9SACH|nr:LANO_0E03796g1_1 [Lachancea nothofagi CBS 11611]